MLGLAHGHQMASGVARVEKVGWFNPAKKLTTFFLFWLARVVALARRAMCFDIQPIYRYPTRAIYYLQIIFN